MGKTPRIWVKNELKHMSEMFSRLSHSYNETEFQCAGVEFSNLRFVSKQMCKALHTGQLPEQSDCKI